MNGLKKFINENDMEFGSKNYDDDFHTDIVFYRASCANIKEYIGISHKKMIAFHKNFISSFYYSHNQTKLIVEKIINKLEEDDEFFMTFEKKYLNACYQLEKLWDLDQLSKIEQYRNQYFLQQEMYKYCWPFEILQTEYGIEYHLKKLLKIEGYSEKECNDILYHNEIHQQNVYFSEKLELHRICLKIKENIQLREIFEKEAKHIVMLLPANIKKEIISIIDKYRYLYYHGFSDRKLPNLYDYIIKIKDALKNEIYFEDTIDIDIMNYKLSKNIERLIHCYKKLSALKSIRRLAQLKNFYYLDQFIEELSNKYNVTESLIRYMTPEEVIQFYNTGKYNIDIEQRKNGMIYLYENGKETIYNNINNIEYFENLINNKPNIQINEFKGKIACRGYAIGPVMKVIRPSDISKTADNVIILTHEGDPDLISILHKAKAIVCEQGGITCHMAVIAREFGIPCIIGVGNNVINNFENNEIVEVDAINGYFRRRKL